MLTNVPQAATSLTMRKACGTDVKDAFALLGYRLIVADESVPSYHTAKTKYHAMLKLNHPDKNRGVDDTTKQRNEDMTKQLTAAWEVIEEYFKEPDPPDEPNSMKQRRDDPKPKKQRKIERPACTLEQSITILQSVGIGSGTDDLTKAQQKNGVIKDGRKYQYIGKTASGWRGQYQVSKVVNSNLRFNCGIYQTQEEAAIAVNLCRIRLENIGAQTYADILDILGFDAEAFANDIKAEVNYAIHSVLSGNTLALPLTNANINESSPPTCLTLTSSSTPAPTAVKTAAPFETPTRWDATEPRLEDERGLGLSAPVPGAAALALH